MRGRGAFRVTLLCEGDAARMMAALISVGVLLAATLTTAAEPPLNVIGENSAPVALNIPAGKGMRYAGPIVYSNEKPPIIYFPPPPKNSKPGFGGPGKKSKSIKYVPMPHHDLPVLIYTSDKMPPIHVVHPPAGENAPHPHPPPPPFSSKPFGVLNPPKEEFRSIPGSLSSAYKGVLPEETSPRIITSSYEIPGTSYGRPMSPMETFDLPASGSSSVHSHFGEISQPFHPKPLSSFSFGHGPHPHISHGHPPRSPFRGPPPPRGDPKSPPHILYSGQTPIHVYDEPDFFVQAPREIPVKTKIYDELPPKASFGPAKPAFGYQSVNSFGPPVSHSPPPRPSFQSFGTPAPYRTISTYVPPRDNVIPSASSQNPSIVSPNSLKSETASSSAAFSQFGGGQPLGARPPTYSFNPNSQKLFSFGPLSIEYGPSTAPEPFVSFSEPQGSLQSFYGALNDGSPTPSDDGWIPGPPPKDLSVSGQLKESVEYSNAPPHSPPATAHQHHGPPPPAPPGPIHGSIFRPQPHGQPPPHPPPFGGSKLANLLSSFKLKRSKPKYSLAPKSMHKPPIIIYYGKKPPVHVYEKPENEHHHDEASTSSSTSPISLSSSVETSHSHAGSDIILNENRNKNNEIIRATHIENIDLTYGASQKSEVRVAPPSPSLSIPEAQQTSPIPQESISRPAIIPAKPVDIFPPTDLDSSIYMARNSINTIFVSDLNGSGSRAIKTYIMRDPQEPLPMPEKMESLIQPEQQEEEGNIGSILSTIAQDRISGEPEIISSSSLPGAPIPLQDENDQVEQVPKKENNEDDVLDTSSTVQQQQTILIVSPELLKEQQQQQSQQEQEQEQKQEEEPVVEETKNVQVQVIQSPSSFQTSLSNAEKEAEEKSSSEAL